MKLLSVVGARPNFIKIAPFLKAAQKHRDIKSILVHTGQHYDYNMSARFFHDLALPRPDIHLGVGSGNHGEQTGRIMVALEREVLKHRPDVMVVVGDVNSTLAGALVAVKLHIPLAHIEAGLRSFDRRMPEEVNRVVTDCLSDYLFVPGQQAAQNLRREGIPRNKIFVVGNIMIDALKQYLPRVEKSGILERLGLKPLNYGLVTLHRPSNVDNKNTFTGIVHSLERISERIPLVFPLHPRTRKQLHSFGLHISGGIKIIEAVGYLDSLCLIKNARLVLTDSGGVQEETTVFGVPCLTLRDETEWSETVKEGTNHLVGTEPGRIFKTAMRIIRQGSKKSRPHFPPYWDGKTSERIVRIIRQTL